MLNLSIVIDVIGWIGAVSVIYAYLMVSIGKMKAESQFYQVLNILGAFCLIINTFWHKAFPSTIVNIIWIGIALYAMNRNGQLKFAFRKKSTPKL